MLKKSCFILSLFLIFSLFTSLNAQVKGYYRYPALHGDNLIFTAEGDLWKHNLASGQTQRLTTNHGVEYDAAISPDGQSIAFLAQYEGPTELYLIPINGGVPKRLTYDENKPRIHGWTSDGKILYSTLVNATLPDAQLFTLDPITFTSYQFPLAQADQAVIAPNKHVYFTKLRKQPSHTKRYKGGTIQHLYVYDNRHEAINLTKDFDGTSKNPMYFNKRIYFLSDRDGAMNIWSMNLNGKNLQQHTFSVEWDYYQPDLDNGRIAFQKGADIQIYNIRTNEITTPNLSILSDFDQRRKQWIKSPKNNISNVALSFKGDKLAITSRARVFTVPVKGERWQEITRQSGIRYKKATFATKEDHLQLISDESGEYELWEINGENDFQQLSRGSTNQIELFSSSPDGKRIIYSEKDNRLYIYDRTTDTSKLIRIGPKRYAPNMKIDWSSDSRWAVFSESASNGNAQIILYDVVKHQFHKVSSENFSSYLPRFSPDNAWLYFVSDRTFNNIVGSPWGPRQAEPYYENTAKIYALGLNKKAKFPFLEENELTIKDTSKEKKNQKEKKEEKANEDQNKDTTLTIDLNGLMDRLYEIRMKAGLIGQFFVNEKYVYWTSHDRAKHTTSLHAKKLSGKKENKSITIAEKVSAFSMSGNRSSIVIKNQSGIFVLKADGSKLDTKKHAVKLDKWSFSIDPVEDWQQMFLDAWRMERDYFYDRNMHGVDWPKIYKQYYPLLARVTDRHELDDLMGQMISELSTLHMFVYGGDKRKALDKTVIGHLGARLHKDQNKKGYVIKHIYQSDPQYPNMRSPLDNLQWDIHEGDIITHVNGVPVLEVDHINILLTNKTGLQTHLTLMNDKKESYEVIVKPISSGANTRLKYEEWEYTRAQEVKNASKNRIGYVHLKAMGKNNYTEWMKGFYPNFNKEGLIIDVRHNRGGNIDSWILSRLLRQSWFFWAPRVGLPSWNMQYAFRGHVVVIMDERTASDGEAFSEGFRVLELGKLIGKRTWGGEIWLSSGNRLVDNGIATAAESGVYDKNGNWLIEGVGVLPDIEVENMPVATFKGKDAQLEKAIGHILQLMKELPITVPPIPDYPNKSVDYNKK